MDKIRLRSSLTRVFVLERISSSSPVSCASGTTLLVSLLRLDGSQREDSSGSSTSSLVLPA